MVFQFQLTFYPHKKEQNCYRQKRFRASKYTKNTFAAGAPHRPRWGSLWKGEGNEGERKGEGGGKGGEEKRRRRGEGKRRGRGKGCPPKRQAWIRLWVVVATKLFQTHNNKYATDRQNADIRAESLFLNVH